MHGIVLFLHTAVGAVALLSFWIAALARKGSRPHRLAGRIYLAAMAAILFSAAPLVLSIFWRGDALSGVFFLDLLVLVGTSVVVAPRAIRYKQDFEAYRGGLYRWLSWLQMGGGAITAIIGFWAAQPVLGVFGLVGAALSVRMLRLQSLQAPPAGWWLREHFTAMIGNGVATHVAFLSIGLMRILPHDVAVQVQHMNLAWFGPLGVSLVAGTWLNLRHRRRFGSRSRRASTSPLTGVSR